LSKKQPTTSDNGVLTSVMDSHTTVWDRLYDPATYTGVYAERFRDGPGINHDTDGAKWKQ
jgi:hypothetical protein